MTEPASPGSPDALAAGCLCPVIDNCHGKGWKSGHIDPATGLPLFVLRLDCPLHGRAPFNTPSNPSERIAHMTTDATETIPEGWRKNALGGLTLESKIKPEDLLEDELVQQIVAEARALSAQLADFKLRAMAETQAFKALLAQEYGASRGGAKGNMALCSYDGTLKVQVQVSEHLSFGAQLQVAKELVDDCVMRWSEGANDKLRALIDHAFQVNKEGRVDTQRVLGLRRLDINDPDWHRAMDAIADAIRVTGSTTYIRFYDRDPRRDKENPIVLNIAKA